MDYAIRYYRPGLRRRYEWKFSFYLGFGSVIKLQINEDFGEILSRARFHFSKICSIYTDIEDKARIEKNASEV